MGSGAAACATLLIISSVLSSWRVGVDAAPSLSSTFSLIKRDMHMLKCLLFHTHCDEGEDVHQQQAQHEDVRGPSMGDVITALWSGNQVLTRQTSMGRPMSVRGNSVRLDVFMEAQCPDTSRFVRMQLTPAWKALGQTGRVDVHLVAFGKARCQEKPDGDYACTCQHGPTECDLNQLMNCVMERMTVEQYMPVIACLQGKRDLQSGMAQCITPNPLLDSAEMLECASGPRGRKLLAIAGAKTASLSPKINFVPWVMLDGERVVDALYALTENICQRMEPKPLGCATKV